VFIYLSATRIHNLYEGLPAEAYRDESGKAYAWVPDAKLDVPGALGQRETELRTLQRELEVILSYWERTAKQQDLIATLEAGTALDASRYYECLSDFRVRDWKPETRLISLFAEVAGHSLELIASKENFPGLAKADHDQRYEPNSQIPEFFIGEHPMRLLAYVCCDRMVDRESRRLAGGALCLVKDPPAETGKAP
jgi:hypothetical protein